MSGYGESRGEICLRRGRERLKIAEGGECIRVGYSC